MLKLSRVSYKIEMVLGGCTMKKCSSCSKQFPKEILKTMVQIIDRKAYIMNVCPSCQSIVNNNPNYYYLADEKKSK
jgi:NAD-dependent SIR2 family protein deacetylase